MLNFCFCNYDFSAKDKSERPFAMSFVKLLNEDCTTLQDCIHELTVYKVRLFMYKPLQTLT